MHAKASIFQKWDLGWGWGEDVVGMGGMGWGMKVWMGSGHLGRRFVAGTSG